MRRSPIVPFLVACLVLASTGVARATLEDPTTFTQSDVVAIDNDPQVTSMAWAPDGSGRLFVTGKEGKIWIIEGSNVLPQTFYTFAAQELVTSSECGLLGIAFDPAFMDNGYVYVFVTLNVPADSDDIEQQIIRFRAVGNMATERTTLIAGLASTGANHDGGALAFGPDGLIYWGVGNNGSGVGEGTDLMSSGSKMGRATTVPGAPAPPGPRNDGAGPNYDYIYARGLRNPYSMTFHPITGKPWVNIVGDGWEQIFVLEPDDHSGYPLENAEPGSGNATVSPVIAYRRDTTTATNLGANTVTRTNNVVTVTMPGVHGLRKGGQVTIAGLGLSSFNGTYAIASVPSTTTFTYANAGGNETTGNGTVLPIDFGTVVLGGTFYDATQFPAAYRQNFFFGDFGQGDLARVETAPDDTVARVSRFGTDFGRHSDMATGPDGSLYVIEHDGQLRKIRYNAESVGIVVSPQNLRVNEASRGVVWVSLSMAPAANVTVNLARNGGSGDISVGGGALTFTPSNWNQPQAVQISAAFDVDVAEDTAPIDVSATGLTTETVTVRVTDTGATPPIIPDGGTLPDARRTGDGGVIDPDEDDGCDCRVGGGGGGLGALLFAALAFLVVRRRRP
jgi:MYXO-CTERM domain-containing protein